MIKKTFFIIFILLSAVFILLFQTQTTQAQYAYYPIQELGNCRNAKECYLYCQIPANTAACWSYDKYVLNGNVLGESDVNISYPIQELGNCATAEACFLYCAQPKNQITCLKYARSQGLVKEDDPPPIDDENEPPPEIIEAAKTELGCSSKESCMAVCNDPQNREKCYHFAKKHGFAKEPPGEHRGPSQEVIDAAKTELGCSDGESCKRICENPDNSEKCFQFAKKHNLLKEGDEEHFQEREEEMEKMKEMFEDAKKELGCSSPQSCKQFCESSSENMVKCQNLAKKHGIEPPDDKMKIKDQKLIGEMQKEMGCDSPDSCKSICESSEENKKKCMGIAQKLGIEPPKKGEKPSDKQNQNQSDSQKKKGPGGCTSETECKQYCEKHPDDCKGFKKEHSEEKFDQQSDRKDQSLQGDNKQNIFSGSTNSSGNKPNDRKEPEKKDSGKGDFLGPGGCKTEGECKAYCEKHSSDCPGFPKDKKQENRQGSSGSSATTQSADSSKNIQPTRKPPEQNSQGINNIFKKDENKGQDSEKYKQENMNDEEKKKYEEKMRNEQKPSQAPTFQ